MAMCSNFQGLEADGNFSLTVCGQTQGQLHRWADAGVCMNVQPQTDNWANRLRGRRRLTQKYVNKACTYKFLSLRQSSRSLTSFSYFLEGEADYSYSSREVTG